MAHYKYKLKHKDFKLGVETLDTGQYTGGRKWTKCNTSSAQIENI